MKKKPKYHTHKIINKLSKVNNKNKNFGSENNLL